MFSRFAVAGSLRKPRAKVERLVTGYRKNFLRKLDLVVEFRGLTSRILGKWLLNLRSERRIASAALRSFLGLLLW